MAVNINIKKAEWNCKGIGEIFITLCLAITKSIIAFLAALVLESWRKKAQ